ncbi:hypothetical protein G6F31_018013 [Rhizopus arrhizus]|nr:hypothetical protein G6F31_018013 [Rhizopus arrhizus]
MTHSPDFTTRRRVLAAAGALAGGSLRKGRVAFAQPKRRRVVYGQGSIDPFFAAGYVALKKGYFSEGGLDVEYLNSQSGPRTNQLLAAGQIVFGATAATAAPALTIAGKPATLVFGFDRKLTYANVIVRREDFDSGKIKSLKDLAGKRVGATQPQWTSARWATWPPCWARSRPGRCRPAWPPCP